MHDAVRPETRGTLVSLATEGYGTLFFDFLPLQVDQVKRAVAPAPALHGAGQVFYEATRKLVLQGADGVVFVADSQAAAMDANLESLASLDRNLVELGHDPATFPCAFQWDERDLPGARAGGHPARHPQSAAAPSSRRWPAAARG